MRPDLSVKLGLITVALATLALAGAWTVPPPAGDHAGTVEQWHRAEVARIQEHLAGAERMLLAADVASLSPSQRVARSRNIELLRGYRERGVFPRNIHFADSREPYFVDDRGVPCAMAYLIASSGRTDIVERIRTTRNNARIRELADDAALIAWLDEAGLTAAEAARIQPMYDGRCVACVIGGDEQDSGSGISMGYTAASVIASAANVFGVVGNIPRRSGAPPRWRGAMALISGAAGMALGASAVGDGGGAGAVGVWNVAVGTLASLAGSHTLFAARARRASSPAMPTAGEPPADGTPRGDVGLRITPTMGARPGLGVTVSF